MTTSAFTILVVDGYAMTRTRILDLLRWAGYSAMGAATVEAALGLLAIFPFDLVVTNLATRDRSTSVLDQVRARRPDVPTMTIVNPVNPTEFLEQVARAVAVGRTVRRWPRKSVPSGLNARIGNHEATVVNISYGGLRVELPHGGPELGASPLIVELPPFSLALQARPVWITEPDVDGPWRCGAELAETNAERIRVWRALVDLLPRSDLPGEPSAPGPGRRYWFPV